MVKVAEQFEEMLEVVLSQLRREGFTALVKRLEVAWRRLKIVGKLDRLDGLDREEREMRAVNEWNWETFEHLTSNDYEALPFEHDHDGQPIESEFIGYDDDGDEVWC